MALPIMKKLTRPLALSTETIRALCGPRLADVAGGDIHRSHGCTTLCLTFYTCPTMVDCPTKV